MSIKTIADLDPWLEPYRSQLEAQRAYVLHKSRELLGNKSIEDFSLGHLYFGLHKDGNEWVFREWAPNAESIYLITEATDWREAETHKAQKRDNGVWELRLSGDTLKHLDTYKLYIHWPGGSGERLPSYTTYTHQDLDTHLFSAVVWSPEEPYVWRNKTPDLNEAPLIYEAHVGMAGDREVVSTYAQFEKDVLPRIKELGYNTIQLMAIQEHPYYGSYGYHVSNLFAASSRFGTPHELKHLIDTAHGMGLKVILDIIHSHAVKNETEGLSKFDGTYTQYFHDGERGMHEAWDSRVYDYGKPEVVHFLLSNLRFWLDEYHFDGFRFDGVTSMLYHDHGLGKAFTSYDDYVSGNVERDALTYLTLANMLVGAIAPDALVVAEDTSAFPGLAAPIEVGGVGFTHRLSMGVPDLWIKTLKEKRDEDWDLNHLYHELIAHRPEEKTISYAESHDQALVGDKTLIFRLIDKDMYDSMQIGQENLTVERGIALHKMIRLFTASTHAGGYLNFMGNEFGHPEWIDFPREGNDWSYTYARRQWSLVDNPKLKYGWLNAFDKDMIKVVSELQGSEYSYVHINNEKKIVSYVRSGLLFVFNFSPSESYTGESIPAPVGEYTIALSSDASLYGGQDRVDDTLRYSAKENSDGEQRIELYLPSRVALVFRQS